MANVKRYIKVRTQFEGFHLYPNAGEIDPRIAFLEQRHRHTFKVEVKIQVDHSDRELEFFLVKWALEEFNNRTEMNNLSCESIAENILQYFLVPNYGNQRYYQVVVSEDGESDGIIEFFPDVL